MLVACSGGLHHVQSPGERWPSPFGLLRMRLENPDIADDRSRLPSEAGEQDFEEAVIRDLTRRRDSCCP